MPVVLHPAVMVTAHVMGARDNRTGPAERGLTVRLGCRCSTATAAARVGEVQVFAAILNRLLEQILTSRRTAVVISQGATTAQWHCTS